MHGFILSNPNANKPCFTMKKINDLMQILPQAGKVQWIGLRPARRAPVHSVSQVQAITDMGLEGDRYRGQGGKRQVTLIQHEHLSAIASMLGQNEAIDPALLRRNIVVSGVNLLALKGKTFRVGEAVFEYTGLCHPCSRMEEIFGDGGYNAVRGHGGINAKVIHSGKIALGDQVQFEE
jgi:MOSC domain-containing protein YiiM